MRRSSGRGFSLIEILVVIVILSGPLIYCLSGVIHSTHSASRHLDCATAHLMLMDFGEWVMAKGHVRPRRLAMSGKDRLVERWIDAQFVLNPPEREQFAKNLGGLLRRVYMEFERAPGGHRGMAKLVIHATLDNGTHLSVPILLRGVPHWRKKGGGKPSPQA